ncbi:hypothetical protein AB1M95_10220 [Sulfitobacter sp. LCG007]
MSETELEELQRRITAALDRVAAGIGTLGASEAARLAELEKALADERAANAALETRLGEIEQQHAAAIAEIEARAATAEACVAAFDLDIQRLRKANTDLATACESLRSANAEGVGDPELINQSAIAEVDALRAARAVDIAEMQQIIAAMTPLLNDAEFEEETA